MKTYTYKIKSVSLSFEQKFVDWIGTCRFLYNSAKELKQTAYRRNGKSPSNYDIQKQLTQAKKEIDFLNQVSRDTLDATLDRLDQAYQTFFDGGGYPNWAKKSRWHTIPFKSVQHKGGNTFRLPKWGKVNVFLSRKFEGKLKTARLKRQVDGYYLQVVTDVDPNINECDSQVGLDVGLRYFLVSSDGEYVDNPQHFKRFERQLRIEKRSLSRKKNGSNNWHKQRRRLQKAYLRLKRVRKDFLHKLSTRIAKEYSVVYIENLNIAGMSKNSRLAKHIQDCGWRIFVNMLSYKTKVVKVDPKYSSQECNACGHVAKENRQSQSKFKCVKCGHTANADGNAANNIKKRGQSLLCDNVAA